MKPPRVRLLLLLPLSVASIALVSAPPLVHAQAEDGSEEAGGKETAEKLEKKLASRFAVLRRLKSDGKIGESWEGTVVARKESVLEEKVELKVDVKDEGEGEDTKTRRLTVRELLAEENADRKALYAILAERRSTDEQVVTPEFVGRQSAKELARRAEPGDWLLLEGDTWVRKPKRP